MITLTATQFQALTMVFSLVTRGVINYAKAHERAEKILNMTDDQLNVAIEAEELKSDLLMMEIDKI